MDQERAFTPSQINEKIKDFIESDPLLSDLWVVGELSNVKQYHLGQQLYFNLSDGKSQLNAVMYASYFSGLKFKPRDGLKVVVKGGLKAFHKRGTYSLQVVYMMEIGSGAQAQSLEQLKLKLQEEGLFDAHRKRPLPLYPRHIALITAENSAAMMDVIKIFKQEAPFLQVTLFPAVVQGANAPTSLRAALASAEMAHDSGASFDLILICRGGGSSEDLSCFNDESWVRALSKCPIPTLSAVGHDIDYTLTDFVSDFRSPTPTAGAMDCTASYRMTFHKLQQRLQAYGYTLDRHLSSEWHRFHDLLQDIESSLMTHFSEHEDHFNRLLKRLLLANPLHQFERGFSICQTDSMPVVNSINALKPGDALITRLKDGRILSTVTQTHAEAPIFTPQESI